jgi:hypothetical protein
MGEREINHLLSLSSGIARMPLSLLGRVEWTTFGCPFFKLSDKDRLAGVGVRVGIARESTCTYSI